MTWKTKQTLKATDPKATWNPGTAQFHRFQKNPEAASERSHDQFLWILCELCVCFFFFFLLDQAYFAEVFHKRQHITSALCASIHPIGDREKLLHEALPWRRAAVQQEGATASTSLLWLGPAAPSDGV